MIEKPQSDSVRTNKIWYYCYLKANENKFVWSKMRLKEGTKNESHRVIWLQVACCRLFAGVLQVVYRSFAGYFQAGKHFSILLFFSQPLKNSISLSTLLLQARTNTLSLTLSVSIAWLVSFSFKKWRAFVISSSGANSTNEELFTWGNVALFRMSYC